MSSWLDETNPGGLNAPPGSFIVGADLEVPAGSALNQKFTEWAKN